MVPILEAPIPSPNASLRPPPRPSFAPRNQVMPSCLIIGDSIALGVAAALASVNGGGCDVRTQVGASSRTINSFTTAREYQAAIISAGTNDSADRELRSNLWQIRLKIRARQVTWIYPRSVSAAWAVHDVAVRFKDRTLGIQRLRSRDGVHPANYRALIPLIFSSAQDRPLPAKASR